MPRDEDYEWADYLIGFTTLDEDFQWSKFWLIKKD
jgi:hypothetical protein